MNKSELTNWLQAENRKWQALLEQIGLSRMEQPGVCGEWSMKDIIAHLADWQPRVNANIQAAQRGEPEPLPPWPAGLQTDDEVNAWIYKVNRERSAVQVLNNSERVFQQLLTVIEGLPDDVQIEIVRTSPSREYYLVWLGDKRFQPGEFFDHFHDDHEVEVRAWLAREEK